MAGLILNRKQLIKLINEMGGSASKGDSNKTLMKKANKLGLGAKKAKPQYIGQPERGVRRKRVKRAGPRKSAEVMRKHRSGELTQAQAMRALGLDASYIQDRVAFEKMECRRNPGPDPYHKDMLILDPGGIAYTGPFGPFGPYDYSRRKNPGLPSPGQVVGMGDYLQINPKSVHTGYRKVTPGKCMQCGSDDDWQVDGRGNVLCSCQACPDCGLVDAYGMHEPGCAQQDRAENPPMGDYLLEREIAPYESAGSINGLSDYVLLDMTPPKRKNPRDVIKKEKVILSGGRRATRWALYNNGQLIAHYRTKKQAQAASREWSSANFLGR